MTFVRIICFLYVGICVCLELIWVCGGALHAAYGVVSVAHYAYLQYLCCVSVFDVPQMEM